MTRMPYLDSEVGLSGETLQVFEYIKASRGNVIGVFSLLLNSPQVAKKVADVGAYLRFDSILPQRLKELVIITTLSENSCQFEWSFHQDFALKADISTQTMEVIKFKKPFLINGEPSEIFAQVTPADRELITYIRELINYKRVSDSSFNKVKADYSTEQITEITALIGYYCMVACQLNAYELSPVPGKPSLPEPGLQKTTETLSEGIG